MIPKEIITLAIEGGWKDGNFRLIEVLGRIVVMQYISEIAPEQPYISWHFEKIALDSAFWQALGKALGWNMEKAEFPFSLAEYVWQNTAYNFYYLILTGDDTDAYWKELLATHK